MVNPAYWQGKKVLVTGHTGFKGSWLGHWLADMGAEVTGFALPTEGERAMFDSIRLDQRMESIYGDINDLKQLTEVVTRITPDVIFHLAAQSLVRVSYADPIETLQTNVMGTANLLSVAGTLEQPCSVVVVTSDKCYRNNNLGQHFTEDDPLGGFDPYSASKACAEIVTASFRQSFHAEDNLQIASVRAGNVIGGGDWAQDRLVPDLVRAWLDNEAVMVRNPDSVRPWQHVLEPLSGYLMLAEKMQEETDLCRAWNFGPAENETVKVRDLLASAQRCWPELKIDCVTVDGLHEAELLLLDSSDARQMLGWQPEWTVDVAISETLDWYRHWRQGEDMAEMTTAQINRYGDVSE